MTLLLDKCGDKIKITEEIIKAAVGNTGSGKEVMMLLLERGEEIKITEEIIKAAVGNTGSGKEVMMLLLERGEEIKITEEVVLVALGNPRSGKEIMTLLLNNRLSRNADGNHHKNLLSGDYVAVLYAASVLGHKDIIEQSIINGTDANVIVGEDGTALHIVAYEGHDSVVQMLLERGADFNIKDCHGWTPYMNALVSKRDSVCRMLSEYDCEKVDLESTTGFIPDRLSKAIISSEVTLTDDGTTAITGLSLTLVCLNVLSVDMFIESVQVSELDSYRQVRGNHPIPTANQLFYFEATVLNGGIER